LIGECLIGRLGVARRDLERDNDPFAKFLQASPCKDGPPLARKRRQNRGNLVIRPCAA